MQTKSKRPRPRPALPKKPQPDGSSTGAEYEAVSHATQRRVLALSLRSVPPPAEEPAVPLPAEGPAVPPPAEGLAVPPPDDEPAVPADLLHSALGLPDNTRHEPEEQDAGMPTSLPLTAEAMDRTTESRGVERQLSEENAEDIPEDRQTTWDDGHDIEGMLLAWHSIVLLIPLSDEESTATQSDYSEAERTKKDRRLQKRKVRPHRSVSPDTEDEDLEDDIALEAEAAPEPGLPSGRNNRSDVARGKQPERNGPSYSGDKSDGNGQSMLVEDEEESHTKLKPGPWPQAAVQECVELGAHIYEEMSRIAEKYGKSLVQVRAKAGLGLVQTRASNPANVFRTMQKLKHPDHKGSKSHSCHLI